MEVLIIGAGVIGVASAAALARRGLEVAVIEQNGAPGQETSSRNSEVIHAGIYYTPGSLKALTCVDGRERLYARCRAQGIPFRRTGKLIVACAPAETGVLESLRERGTTNGAGCLDLLDAAEVRRREPRVRAVAALWSPESGIVDGAALLASYQAEAESRGASLVVWTRAVGLERHANLWRVTTRTRDGETFTLDVPCVVNAAGLASDRIASLAGLDVDALGYRLHPCKGDYFAVAPALGSLAERLVYPVPSQAGLGIHVTLDLGGRYRLGPDTEYVESPRYDVDPDKATDFAADVQRYMPEIRAEHLSPEFAGVRPKLQAPGEPFRDFVIEEASAYGAPGLVNLIGIESPGLTAAEAIAERVAALVSASLSA